MYQLHQLSVWSILLAVNYASASAGYPPIPSDKSTPVQQRTSFYGPDEMAIAWNTYENLDQACVKYGTSSDSLSSKACSSTSFTYDTSRTWFHAVKLTGLKPATKYFYKIESGNSSVEHFTSPRAAGDTTAFEMSVVVDLGIYGKNGFTSSSKRDMPAIDPELKHSTIGALANTIDDYEFVIHPGDFAYADDWVLVPSDLFQGKEAYEAILEGFYDQLAPIAGRKAYMASPGNHEADCQEIDFTSSLCPEGQNNFTDFMNRFGRTMPTTFPSQSKDSKAQSKAKDADSLANPPFWYSFEYGMTHIVMFDTETDFKNAPDGPDGSAHLDGGPFGFPSQQVEFLKADLASVDRSVTPWLIVAGHRPWYALGDEHCGACQTAFEDIFYKYGVDLAVFGHVHNSQRFDPIYQGKVDSAGLDNPKAPMYIVAGGAGNIEGPSKISNNVTGNVFGYADEFGYATVQFMDKKHLGVKFYRSTDGELLDSSVLYKEHNEAFVRQS